MKPGRFFHLCLAAVLAGALQLAWAAPATAQQTVVVPKRIIYPGEVVEAGLVSEVRFTNKRSLLASVAVLPQDVEGKVARRTLLPGRLIPLSSLRDAYAVEAGTPIELVFISGPLMISVTGVPLQSGAVGDLIRVRNIDSGTVVTGVVLADGTVRVGAI